MSTSHSVDPFTLQSLMWCINSMVLGIADYVTDIMVAAALSKEEGTGWWFTLTLIFAIVPLIIVNVFSIFWFHQDHIKFRKHQMKKTIINGEDLERPKGGIFRPRSHSFSDKERKVIIASHVVGFGPILR